MREDDIDETRRRIERWRRLARQMPDQQAADALEFGVARLVPCVIDSAAEL